MALGPLAHVDAHRVAFVNGQHRAELDDVSEAPGLKMAALGEVACFGVRKICDRVLASTPEGGRRHRGAQYGVHDRWRNRPRRRRRGCRKAAADRFRPSWSARRVRSPCAISLTIGDGATATIIEAHVVLPGAAPRCSGQRADGGYGRQGRDAAITPRSPSMTASACIFPIGM